MSSINTSKFSDKLSKLNSMIAVQTCPNCGHRWKPYKKNALQCPVCHKPISLDAQTELRERRLNYCRQHTLGTTMNGKPIHLTIGNKRDHTARCEICNKKKNRLSYHHWDDTYPNRGIWVCMHCHGFAETLDKGTGYVWKYLDLKTKINQYYSSLTA